VNEIVNKEKSVKKHQSDMTGRYILHHPLFAFIKPKLYLYRKEGKGKIEGEICLLGLKRKLRLVKHKEKEWIFQYDVSIVTIDVVIKFSTENAFKGFVDTPVGHIRFTGKKVG